VTEQQWLVCADPQAMLTVVKGVASDRKLRLFACACCRRNWGLLADERSRAAVEAAERFADSLGTRKDLEAAKAAALGAASAVGLGGPGASDSDRLGGYYAAAASARCAERQAIAAASQAALWAVGHASLLGPDGAAAQCELLRDLFGSPFGPPPAVEEATLAWGDGAVCRVAQSIYGEGRFEDMPILADALEDAGCSNAGILDHCRGPGVHARGCFVLDLLLGRG